MVTGFKPCVLRAARSSALSALSSASTACTLPRRASRRANVPDPQNKSAMRLDLPTCVSTSSAMASSAGLVACAKPPDGGEIITPSKSISGFCGSIRISPAIETRAMARVASVISVAVLRCLSVGALMPSKEISSPVRVSMTVIRNGSAFDTSGRPMARMASKRETMPSDAMGHSSMATM